ncbi:MAG: hypothetical protein Q9O74_07275 [Planctomycetota bacterium]|nr:hypothetical protein [Planctomycetota bacterium]
MACRAIRAGLISDDHFSIDGTLIESDASIKSFKPIEAGADDRSVRMRERLMHCTPRARRLVPGGARPSNRQRQTAPHRTAMPQDQVPFAAAC